MESTANIVKITRSIGTIVFAIFCLTLIPSPAFDACNHSNGAFVCGQWSDFVMGALFVTICYFGGPKIKAHYFVTFVFYLVLGSAENIRFGSYPDALYQAPFQEFYYGGIIAAFLIALFFIFKSKVVKCT